MHSPKYIHNTYTYMHISKCTFVHTYHTYTPPPPPDTHVHPRSYVHQLPITFSLNITMEVIARTATFSTIKMAANLTQIHNFKPNFHKEFKLFNFLECFDNGRNYQIHGLCFSCMAHKSNQERHGDTWKHTKKSNVYHISRN